MSCMHALPLFLVHWYVLLCIFSYRFVVSISRLTQYISSGSTVSADSSDLSSSSAGSTEIPWRSKKYRRVALHSRKEVVDVDAMLSDACPVRMLKRRGVRRSHFELRTNFVLAFFCMCLCCGWVHWHLLCWGWGETSGCPTLWECSMVCIGKNIANCSNTPNFFLSCARCARPVHTRPHQLLGSTDAKTTPAGTQAAQTNRTRTEERVTVQGPIKEQQLDGMSHRGLPPGLPPLPPLLKQIPGGKPHN